MKELFDGIDINVKITGKIYLDVVIDSLLFKELPASVQKEIIKRGMLESP